MSFVLDGMGFGCQSELLLCPLRHKVGPDIDKCFGDVSDVLAGGSAFCLSELSNWRNDIASDGMTVTLPPSFIQF